MPVNDPAIALQLRQYIGQRGLVEKLGLHRRSASEVRSTETPMPNPGAGPSPLPQSPIGKSEGNHTMSIREEAQAQAELERRARRAGVEPFIQKMREATDESLLRDVVRDGRRPIHERSSILPASGARPSEHLGPHQCRYGAINEPVNQDTRHSRGWVEPAPLRNGMDRNIERLIDGQDAIDRAARERQFGKRGE